jgi:hypothetical protein
LLRLCWRQPSVPAAGCLIARQAALHIPQERDEKKDKEREHEDVEHVFLPQRPGAGLDGRIVIRISARC